LDATKSKNLDQALQAILVLRNDLRHAQDALKRSELQIVDLRAKEEEETSRLQRELDRVNGAKKIVDDAFTSESAELLLVKGQRDQLQSELEVLKAQIRPIETPPDPLRPPLTDKKPAPRPTRPLRMGIALGTEAGSPGALCCFVKDRQGRRYLMSLASVLQGKPGDMVLQPPSQQGGTAADKVAVLSRVSNDGLRSAAIAERLPGIEFNSEIQKVGKLFKRGKLNGIESGVYKGDKVVLVRPSGGVQGKVLSVNGATITINVPSTPADWGAPVLSHDRELIGLVFGSEGGQSSVVHIKRILHALKVDLIDGQGLKLD